MAQARESGLTLVELMVVLLVIGLVSAAVVLTLPPGGDRLDQDARALAADLRAAARASVIAHGTTGVLIDGSGYTLLRLSGGRWSSAGSRRHDFGAPLAIDLAGRDGRAPPPGVPFPVFDAAGIATPFRLGLARGGERRVVAGDDGGRIRVETGDG